MPLHKSQKGLDSLLACVYSDPSALPIRDHLRMTDWRSARVTCDFSFKFKTDVERLSQNRWTRARPDFGDLPERLDGKQGLYQLVFLTIPADPASSLDGTHDHYYVGESGNLGARLRDYHEGRGKHGQAMRSRILEWLDSESGAVHLYLGQVSMVEVDGDSDTPRHVVEGGFDRLLAENAAIIARQCDPADDTPLLNKGSSRKREKPKPFDDAKLPF